MLKAKVFDMQNHLHDQHKSPTIISIIAVCLSVCLSDCRLGFVNRIGVCSRTHAVSCILTLACDNFSISYNICVCVCVSPRLDHHQSFWFWANGRSKSFLNV